MKPGFYSSYCVLLIVFVLGTSTLSWGAGLEICEVAFSPPEGSAARYHLAFELNNNAEQAVTLKSVDVGDTSDDHFAVYVGEELIADSRIDAGQKSRVLVAYPWVNRQPYSIKVTATAGENELRASRQAVAPERGGYWNPAWRHYKVIDLVEEAGVPRQQEPVEISLNFLADRMRDPAKELRLVALVPNKQPVQVPFQVLRTTSVASVEESFKPTAAATILFYADVPANGRQRYLVFYNNPNAPAPAAVETDLRVDGAGLGLTIENPYYRMTLAGKSGQIDGIFIKQGVDQQLSHSGNAIHWNPGCYSPPRPWGHTCDWNPPEGHSEIRGPLMYVLKRWGQFPQLPEVWAMVTYKFYAYSPHIEMSSTIAIREDIDVLALRNDEMVFEEKLFSSLGWRDHAGRVHTTPLGQNPDLGKGYTEVLAADTPWLCLYSQDGGYGFGSVRLAYDATSTSPQDAVSFNENTFVTAPAGIVYWYRALAYHFFPTPPDPEHLFCAVKAGAVYHETNAYLAFPLGKAVESQLEPMAQTYARLSKPLRVSSVDWGRDHLLSADQRKDE